MTTEQIRHFLSRKRGALSATTTNLYRRVLSVFFLRAVKHGFLPSNPVLPIKVFKASRDEASQRRALSVAEIRLLHDKAPNLFWRYMIVGGFYTGLRLGDMATLRWGAVDFNENIIRTITRRTGRSVQIPMANAFRTIVLLVREETTASKSGDYLFPDYAGKYEKQGAKVLSKEFYEQLLVPSGLAAPRSHHKKKHGKGRAAERDTSAVSFH